MESHRISTHAGRFVHFSEVRYESEEFRIPNCDNCLFLYIIQTFISMLSLKLKFILFEFSFQKLCGLRFKILLNLKFSH